MLYLQFYAICVLVLAGATLGLLYDLLRAVRERVRRRSWVGDAIDICFWTLATMALGCALLMANWGDLRGYVPLSAAVGLIAYRALASPVVLRCARALVGAARLLTGPAVALGRRWSSRNAPKPK